MYCLLITYKLRIIQQHNSETRQNNRYYYLLYFFRNRYLLVYIENNHLYENDHLYTFIGTPLSAAHIFKIV